MAPLSVICLVLAGASQVASFSRFAPSLAPRLNANKPIDAFVDSLRLQKEQVQVVHDYLVKDSNLDAYLEHRSYDSTQLAATACGTLEILLGKDSVDTSPVNETVVQESWSQTAWLSPNCASFPDAKADVSLIIKTVQFFGTQFVVRSGGHSPNPGFSSLAGPGLLIDLQRLNRISLSRDGKTVALEPGARWGAVYSTLDPYNVSVIGARIPHVGVGGTFLGGGYFHFSGQYGTAADNLKNVNIVLANGSIIDANAKESTDLFWALKGGGPNYGIVVEYVAYTTPVKDMWYQAGIYASAQVPAILDAFAKWQNTGAADLKSTVALIIGLQTTTLGFFYSEPASKPKAFELFYDIPSLAVAIPPTNGTVNSLTQVLGSTFSNVPQRHDYRAASSKVDAQLYNDVYDFWRQEASAVHNTTGANMTFTLQPVPANLAQEGSRKGGNPMGVPTEAHQWWTTIVDWTHAKDDEIVRAVPIATEKKWKELSEKRGLDVKYRFLNDASRDQNPLATYGTENLQRLKQIAIKYDPGKVFQNLQNDGFLIYQQSIH